MKKNKKGQHTLDLVNLNSKECLNLAAATGRKIENGNYHCRRGLPKRISFEREHARSMKAQQVADRATVFVCTYV